MIEHLKGRDKNLRDFDWTGTDAEWIALVCLHSGVFIRSQYAAWRATSRTSALRLVHKLLAAKVAVEQAEPNISQQAPLIRIYKRRLYNALGAPNVRHRKDAGPDVFLRRLLSLDYVLENIDLPWLPTEPEKVQYCESLGIAEKLLPKKTYAGAVGSTPRYFSIKVPVAAEQDRVTFVYTDPEEVTDKGLRTWGAAHFPLWEQLREKGKRVRVVAVSRKLDRLKRCERILKQWASGPFQIESNEKSNEIERINQAIDDQDEDTLADYGGLSGAIRAALELEKPSPGDSPPKSSSIDEYHCWWSNRVAAVQDATD